MYIIMHICAYIKVNRICSTCIKMNIRSYTVRRHTRNPVEEARYNIYTYVSIMYIYIYILYIYLCAYDVAAQGGSVPGRATAFLLGRAPASDEQPAS